mgnify:CR=1 FL=1
MSESMVSRNDEGEKLVADYLGNPRSEIKDSIIQFYEPVVRRIARRFRGIEAEEDLIQVGFIGLLNALTKFDPDAGVRFNTYATHLVAGEIKHYLRDRSRTIRQPAWLQELRHKVQKTTTSMLVETGHSPSDREVAERLGMTENAVREVHATQELLRVGSLDATMGEEDSDSEIDRLDATAFAPEQLSVEDRVVLESAMEQLRDLERDVLVLFHFESLSQTEIAAQLGISNNYVSHVLRQSLAKLRRILNNETELDTVLQSASPANNNDVMDVATNSFTEAYFRSRLTEEVHRAKLASDDVALLNIEFSGFESIASYYGQASVNDLLADAAEVIRSDVRSLDIVCRHQKFGFAVILPFTGEAVSVVTDRLRRRLTEWLGTRVTTQAYFDIVFSESHLCDETPDAETMLEAAVQQSARFKGAA